MPVLKILILACIYLPWSPVSAKPAGFENSVLVKIREAPTLGPPSKWFSNTTRQDLVGQVIWLDRSSVTPEGYYVYRLDGADIYIYSKTLSPLNPSPTACAQSKLCKDTFVEVNGRRYQIEDVYRDYARDEYVVTIAGEIFPASLATPVQQ